MDTNTTEMCEVCDQMIPLPLLREAIDWMRDCTSIANSTFVSFNRAYRYVVNNYEGGWSGFVASSAYMQI